MERYGRPSSPGGRRVAQSGGRSSTGVLVFPSSYDPYYGPSRSATSISSGPRTSAERMMAPRVAPVYRPQSPPVRTQARDDYAVRPRRLTLDANSASARRPLSMVIPTSPGRSARPVITTAVDRPSSPLARAPLRVRPSDDYYLQPASSMRRGEHRRNYSVGAVDGDRLAASDRERDRERAGYRGTGTSGPRGGYQFSQQVVRPPKERDDRSVGYEYTDPREQAYRDTAPRPRPRRDSYNAAARERPISMTGLEDYMPRETRINREAGPPVSTRGFDNIVRSGSVRQETRPREGSLARDYQGDRYETVPPRSSNRPQVSLHQTPSDGYEKPREATDDRHEPRLDPSRHRREEENLAPKPRHPVDNRVDDHTDDHSHKTLLRKHRKDIEDDRERHHRHREERHRDEARKERPEKLKDDHGGEAAVLGAAALAAGGVAGDAIKHRHHDRDPRESDVRSGDDLREKPRERERTRLPIDQEPNTVGEGPTNANTSDEERRERRRRRRREREERRNVEAKEERDKVEIKAARKMEHEEAVTAASLLPRDDSLREQGHYDRPPGEKGLPIDQPAQFEEPKRPTNRQRSVSYAKEPDSSESSSDEDRRRLVRVVTPANDSKEPEQPIKGILRAPREKFPEDPAPIREGVAPLKDAGKSGIPPNARWTKIDRRLVNPEALEMGNERYEERDNYVIVLRVLTKDEIQAYAAKTQEIRSGRSTTTASDSQRELEEDEDEEEYRKRR